MNIATWGHEDVAEGVAAVDAALERPLRVLVGRAVGRPRAVVEPARFTGLRYLAGESFNKRLGFLREIDPKMTQVAVLFQRGSPFAALTRESMKPTANALKLELRPQEASGVGEYGAAFSVWTEAKVTGLVIHDNPESIANAKPVAALAVQHRMRSIGSLEHTANGGLMAYSVDFEALSYRSAFFVDRILKGSRPGDLPIERPTEVSVCRKPCNRQDVWPHSAVDSAGPRRRGDRVVAYVGLAGHA